MRSSRRVKKGDSHEDLQPAGVMMRNHGAR